MFRVSTDLVDYVDVRWKEAFDQLMGMLSDDDRKDLKRDQQQPYDMRNAYLCMG